MTLTPATARTRPVVAPAPVAALTAPAPPPVNILAISDRVEELVYSAALRERFGHVDLVLSCGDLPAAYLDFIVSTLNVPLLGVHGNHDHGQIYDQAPYGSLVPGTVDLHGRVVRSHGLLIAGLGGSPTYNFGPHQYGEAHMRLTAVRLAPHLFLNKLRYGRYLDILVTHAPPRGIHDRADRCHRGFETFRWFLRTFRPRYHLHGHIHVYDWQTTTRTQFGDTLILNVYGHQRLQIAAERAVATARA